MAGTATGISSALSVETLQQELLDAEQALQENERQRSALEAGLGDDENEAVLAPAKPPLALRLARLESAANELLLTQKVAEWKKQYVAHKEGVLKEAEMLERLVEILLTVEDSLELFERLTEDDILPYCDYLFEELKFKLRELLQRSDYPSTQACHDLLSQKGADGSTFDDIVHSVNAMFKLDKACRRLVQNLIIEHHLDSDAVLHEFCRPFVERVEFHFLEQSGQRPTSNRIDRLPEWICSYVKEHVFENGPWDLLNALLAPTGELSMTLLRDFVNEMVRLVQWVLGERNFFRHPSIVGPDAKPSLLMNAIEQFIRFDEYTESLFGRSSVKILKLMDVFVGGDDELLRWWLEREREYVFSTLFHEPIGATTLLGRVSPRAELFCSLIRSIQCKASVFSFSGPYLSSVAAPLCMQFVDAVDDTSASLRARLVGREHTSDFELEENVNEWIELINGTHMASLILCCDVGSMDQATSGGDQDLTRFGRSLHSLEAVLVDEFAKAFVGTLLLERTKLASYLIRCSHLLACDRIEELEMASLSSDLVETQTLLARFLAVCDGEWCLEEDSIGVDAMERAQYAPKLLKEKVLCVLGGKIIEVALNLDDMTPDLFPAGGAAFAEGIKSLFGVSLVPEVVLRLIDISRIMAMESFQLSQLGDALCGLVGHPAPLELDYFVADERLYEEAMSMVNAKGLLWIELGDLLNILNRRRDLIPGA